MSAEMITTLVGVLSILLAFAGGFGWLIHRIDNVDSKLGARIDGLDDKLTACIDNVEEKLGVRIDRVADELVEVKIAVARLEGQPRHFLPAR